MYNHSPSPRLLRRAMALTGGLLLLASLGCGGQPDPIPRIVPQATATPYPPLGGYLPDQTPIRR